jgi:aryl-alcohol dehydrogenase
VEITAAVLPASDAPFELAALEIDDPRAGEVLVRIAGTGMCHTDLLLRLPGIPFPLPMVLGHEGAGVVEAVGPGVTTVAPGDHVVLSYASCGTCRNCRTGVPQYCDLFGAANFSGARLDGSSPLRRDGVPMAANWFGQSSFASHALASERNVVVVDRDAPLELLGPLGCGIQTGAGTVLNTLGAGPGSSLVVFGTGAVGMAAVLAARVAGCTTIVGVDLHANRRDLALELGATHVLDGADDDVAAQVRSVTGGGADFAFDTTAVPAVITAALTAVRSPGTVALVGAGGPPLTLDQGLLTFGKRLVGVIEGDAVPQDFIPRLVRLHAQGRFPFDRLVRTFPLGAINEAEAASLSGEVIKPVLVP